MLKKMLEFLQKKDNRIIVGAITIFSTFALSILSVYIADNFNTDGIFIIYILQIIAFILISIAIFVYCYGIYFKLKEKFNKKEDI